jgi:succinate dehydrogenase / fumarate reductase flavoprotein subunit
MQGLADGYFVVPYTVADYLASAKLAPVNTEEEAFTQAAQNAQEQIDRILSVRGRRTVRDIHRELGLVMWDFVGMSREDAGLRKALSRIPQLRAEFWSDVSVPGTSDNLNKTLEYAGRVADYLEFGELLALDALHRAESCGGHFREESQTPDGEALRDDANFSYAAAWQFNGVGKPPTLVKEQLEFEHAHPSQRSYV